MNLILKHKNHVTDKFLEFSKDLKPGKNLWLLPFLTRKMSFFFITLGLVTEYIQVLQQGILRSSLPNEVQGKVPESFTTGN